MNKKAFLLAEETLKIIVALIAISFLVYLLTSLYFTSVNNQKKREAEAELERILEIINNPLLEIEEVPNPLPFGWSLFSFVGDEKKPNSCLGKNCLCICYNIKVNLFDRQIKKCDKDGVCGIVENLEEFGEIKIKKGIFSIEIENRGGKIIVRGK